jgi:hypothetical protein
MPDYTHHATTATSTLKQLSELSPIPYLKVVAGVSLLILETIQVGFHLALGLGSSNIRPDCQNQQRAMCNAS